MAIILLGANNTDDISDTAINVSPNWTSSGNLYIEIPGTVSHARMKMFQNSAVQSNGGHTVELYDRFNDLIATGTFDAEGLIPKGDPAAWYTINLTGSPVVEIGHRLVLRAQMNSSGGIKPSWRNQDTFTTC